MKRKKQGKDLDLQRFLTALRDPEIGPKIRAYIDMRIKEENAKEQNT